MGNVSQDLARLRDEISRLRTERQAFLTNLQTEWRNTGSSFVQGLHKDVQELQKNARDNQKRLRQEFQNTVKESFEQRRQFVNSLHTESQQRMQRNRSELAKNKAETEAQLKATVEKVKADIQSLKGEVKEFLTQVNAQQARNTADLRQDLQAVRTRLNEFGKGLAQDTRNMMSGFVKDLQEDAKASRDSRTQFVQNLQGSLAELRTQVETLRASFRRDLDSARHAWGENIEGSEFEVPVRQEHEETSSAAPATEEPSTQAGPTFDQSSEPESRPETESQAQEASQDQVDDDLTRIDGIGPGRKKQLNEAGIWSFSLLAAMSPEQLQQVVGEHTRVKILERWIDQAKELSA